MMLQACTPAPVVECLLSYVCSQGLGYVDSTPTPKLQEALQLKAGIVTSGVCSQAQAIA